MNIFALIPARSGSKSVVNKNLQEIAGKSLLETTIQKAQECNSQIDIYVSSDSDKILEHGKILGCGSIKRPEFAANDLATANDVVQDFIDQLDLKSRQDSLIVYLQPTSPFRESGMIDRGIEMSLAASKPVVAISKVQQHPNKMLKIGENGEIEPYLKESDPTANRQSLPNVHIPTGSLYVFSIYDFFVSSSIPIRGALPLIVSGVYALDIDDEIDLKIAQEIGNANEF